MNIKILDSWLRDYLETKATPKQIAEKLSLASVAVERLEKVNNDYLYDIEVTTNRPELMSIVGIAQEAATILPQAKIPAKLLQKKYSSSEALAKSRSKGSPQGRTIKSADITFKNDPKLVRRICAVIMEVTIKDSPKQIKERLEATGIRSLNNVIDVTNYVMREIGHPTHVFDYDRLPTKKLIIRESKKGEKVTTLDGKTYTLSGGDIVADNGKGEIVDLLGVMGTANSVVTNETKRILFFIDTVEPKHIRKTSMEHAIRTEAAVLNEKGINPEYAADALARGIQLFQKIADAKVVSEIIDIYPEKPKATTIIVTEEKINSVVGVAIPLRTSIEILAKLGFEVLQKETTLHVTVPPHKSGEDMTIPEDLIEEIARVYGYHNIPDTIPYFETSESSHSMDSEFYWEDRIKDALKYWGFTETYTYPMVSHDLLQGEPADAVTIQNPLTDDMVYMRQTLIPSLLQVAEENKDHEIIKLFEIANVYHKNGNKLPLQSMKLAVLIRKPRNSFYVVKGIIEQLLADSGIIDVAFKHLTDHRYGAEIFITSHPRGAKLSHLEGGRMDSFQVETLGTIEIHDNKAITFELDFALLLKHATRKKYYKPLSKYPPIVEDLALIAPATVLTGDLMEAIKKQHPLITNVSLLDKYQDTRTFHIIYQSYEKNLTDKEIGEIREKILKTVKEKYNARLKE